MTREPLGRKIQPELFSQFATGTGHRRFRPFAPATRQVPEAREGKVGSVVAQINQHPVIEGQEQLCSVKRVFAVTGKSCARVSR